MFRLFSRPNKHDCCYKISLCLPESGVSAYGTVHLRAQTDGMSHDVVATISIKEGVLGFGFLKLNRRMLNETWFI